LKPIKKQQIEDFVVAEAMKILSDDKALERVADAAIDLQSKGSVAIPLLRQQLTETEKQIDNMVAAIAQGIITPSTKRKLNDLENEKEDLEIKLLQEEMSQKILTREQILFWLHKFRDTDIAQRDVRVRLIDCFVNAVYVYDDGKAVVTLNYRGGAETVKLSEIEDVFGSTMYMLAPVISRLFIGIKSR
jgi:hypothetical protein